MTDDSISKSEITLIIEATNKQTIHLERIAIALKEITEDQKAIKNFIIENRIYYPKEIIGKCEERSKGFKDSIIDVEDAISKVVVAINDVNKTLTKDAKFMQILKYISGIFATLLTAAISYLAFFYHHQK